MSSITRIAVCAAVLGVASIFPSSSLIAEVVHLSDGSSVEGTLKRTSDGYDVTDGEGKVIHVSAESVKGIELGARGGGAVETESRLASLRRSVENTTDIRAILERYTRFIDQNKTSPIARDAEHDVVVWRDRLDKGMVKVGTKWVTPAEREQVQERGLIAADHARQLLKQGRMKDADPVLQAALEEDPSNVSASYLRGFLYYKQDQLPVSRKNFEAVTVLLKDHAPTLNNLAVILWRQNQPVAALNLYDQAMVASPLNKEVLNNVAEALNSLPAAQKTSLVAQKAIRHFTEQDTQLQQQMTQMGWYRWGSTWVDRTQIQRLEAIEKEINKKLDGLAADYDEKKKQIDRIDDDIDDNLRRMKSMEATSYGVDAQGNPYRLPLPRRYYDLEADNRKLLGDRSGVVKQLNDLRATAKQVQQQIPTPRFTSVQQVIGVEGTPILPPTKAAGPPGVEAPVKTLDPAARTAPPVASDAPAATPATLPATQPASAPAIAPDAKPSLRPTVPDSLLSPT